MKNDFYQNVGEKIRVRRREKKISQGELAQKLGKSSSTYVALIESGKRKVSLENLIQIAEALEVKLNFFLEERNHHLDPEALLDLALESQKQLSTSQKNMIKELVNFFQTQHH